jgi:GAF domain-containing protein/anti-sigma regulatory factor (Ser/Thr protein kinase)
VRAFVGRRLDAAGEPVGILYVNFRQAHRWTKDELATIKPFVDQAAMTIQHTRLQQRRSDALQGIIQTGHDITSALDRRSILERIVVTAKVSLGADIITLHPYDQTTGEFGAEYVRMKLGAPDIAEWTARSSKTAEKILESKEARFSDNSPSDPVLGSDFVRNQRIVASAGLPLIVGRETVGIMFVNYCSPHHFSGEERDIIRMLANEAALAMHNARLFDRIERGQQRLQTVVDMSRRFSSSLELNQVIDTLLDGLQVPFPQANSRKVLSYDRYAEHLIIHPASYKYYWSDAKAEEIKKPIPTSISIGGWVVRHRRPLNVPDVSQDNRYLELIPGTRSQLSAPIMFGEDVIGVLTLESSQPSAFSDEDQSLLMGLADQACVAIENARRYQQIGARTALAWMGIAGATWFHSIRGSAATLKDWLYLIRQKLADEDTLAPVAGDFDSIDAEMEKLLEIPTRGVLPTKSELKPVPINRLLEEVSERLCQPRQDVRLHLDLHGGDALSALADSHWLVIAIEYLVKNALQAMKHGGRLRIETREEHEKVKISIADTGPGIPERLGPKVFKQPLTREDGANGSGMGLLIVKMILDACHGDITFDSPTGSGTTFVIWLLKASPNEQIIR